MKNFFLLLYPALLLILTFSGAKIIKKAERSPEYLSLDQAKMIRAAACLGIMLHHLTQEVTGYNVVWKWPITVFNNLGFVFTGLFFFFSGFGLITNVYVRPEYLRHFLSRRLTTVLIPFWMINLMGIALNRFVRGTRYTVPEVLRCLFGLTLVNSNGWFIIEIVILYLFFYLLFRLIRKKDLALTLLCAATVFIICFSIFRGHGGADGKSEWFRGEWWFNSTPAFIFGLLYARFHKKTDAFCIKHHSVLLSLFAVLSVLSWQMSVYTVERCGYYQPFGTLLWLRASVITLVFQSLTCIACIILVLLMNMRLLIGNRVLKYISGITTELFLIHGYFINPVFSGIKMSGFLLYAAVISCSIACAVVLSPFIKGLTERVSTFLVHISDQCSEKITARAKKSDGYETLESQIAARIRKKRRKILLITAAAVSGIVMILLAGNLLLERREFEKEYEKLQTAAVGEEVFWGRDDTDFERFGKERLAWIVIRREETEVYLLSRYGLSGSCYNQKHQAVSWEESDLRAVLQSEAYTGLFSRYEAAVMTKSGGDLITLLTAKEAAELFETDQARELAITPAAKAAGTNINTLSKDNNWDMKGYRSSWWWLRGEDGRKDVYAPIVTVDGEIKTGEKEVNRPNGAVRPVICINKSHP